MRSDGSWPECQSRTEIWLEASFSGQVSQEGSTGQRKGRSIVTHADLLLHTGPRSWAAYYNPAGKRGKGAHAGLAIGHLSGSRTTFSRIEKERKL